MKTIWKFALEITDTVIIRMPRGAEPLCVQMQRDVPHVWALVDIESIEYEQEERTFYVRGTGHPCAGLAASDYLGTFQMHDGALVFHVFVVR